MLFELFEKSECLIGFFPLEDNRVRRNLRNFGTAHYYSCAFQRFLYGEYICWRSSNYHDVVKGQDIFRSGLEPGFQFSSRTGTELADESVIRPFITLTARRILGFTIDRHQPDGEVYFEAGYDFNTFELSTVTSTNDAINTNFEVGLGFGFSQTRPKIWFITLPRMRVGYRFGDLEGWRIRFGGDWLTRVAGLNTPGS